MLELIGLVFRLIVGILRFLNNHPIIFGGFFGIIAYQQFKAKDYAFAILCVVIALWCAV